VTDLEVFLDFGFGFSGGVWDIGRQNWIRISSCH
jgi:hypothetical protein